MATAAGKPPGAGLASAAELEVKKTSAFSGGTINTADTDYYKEGSPSPLL
jgi:hypothetical protein